MANSDNPRTGREFQELVCVQLGSYFATRFDTEVPLFIGAPPKAHRFDCVSNDRTIVVECKSYSWTETGNVPSAKLMGLNEAVFYMSYLPPTVRKIIAIRKASYPGKKETLAQYYCRINGHLLRDVEIVEVDDLGDITWIR